MADPTVENWLKSLESPAQETQASTATPDTDYPEGWAPTAAGLPAMADTSKEDTLKGLRDAASKVEEPSTTKPVEPTRKQSWLDNLMRPDLMPEFDSRPAETQLAERRMRDWGRDTKLQPSEHEIVTDETGSMTTAEAKAQQDRMVAKARKAGDQNAALGVPMVPWETELRSVKSLDPLQYDYVAERYKQEFTHTPEWQNMTDTERQAFVQHVDSTKRDVQEAVMSKAAQLENQRRNEMGETQDERENRITALNHPYFASARSGANKMVGDIFNLLDTAGSVFSSEARGYESADVPFAKRAADAFNEVAGQYETGKLGKTPLQLTLEGAANMSPFLLAGVVGKAGHVANFLSFAGSGAEQVKQLALESGDSENVANQKALIGGTIYGALFTAQFGKLANISDTAKKAVFNTAIKTFQDRVRAAGGVVTSQIAKESLGFALRTAAAEGAVQVFGNKDLSQIDWQRIADASFENAKIAMVLGGISGISGASEGMANYYRVNGQLAEHALNQLGLKRGASADEIRRSFDSINDSLRKEKLRTHPDRGGSEESFKGVMNQQRAVDAAYEFLTGQKNVGWDEAKGKWVNEYNPGVGVIPPRPAIAPAQQQAKPAAEKPVEQPKVPAAPKAEAPKPVEKQKPVAPAKAEENPNAVAAANYTGKDFAHYTSPESADALKGGAEFDTTRPPQHLVYEGNSGHIAPEQGIAGRRLYLSLNDTRWGNVYHQHPDYDKIQAVPFESLTPKERTNPENFHFFDYDKQEWMSKKGGLVKKNLAPVQYRLSPTARVRVIDAADRVQKGLSLNDAMSDVGAKGWGPELWDKLAQKYDAVAIINTDKAHPDSKFARAADGDQVIVLNRAAVSLAPGQAKEKVKPAAPIEKPKAETEIKPPESKPEQKEPELDTKGLKEGDRVSWTEKDGTVEFGTIKHFGEMNGNVYADVKYDKVFNAGGVPIMGSASISISKLTKFTGEEKPSETKAEVPADLQKLRNEAEKLKIENPEQYSADQLREMIETINKAASEQKAKKKAALGDKKGVDTKPNLVDETYVETVKKLQERAKAKADITLKFSDDMENTPEYIGPNIQEIGGKSQRTIPENIKEVMASNLKQFLDTTPEFAIDPTFTVVEKTHTIKEGKKDKEAKYTMLSFHDGYEFDFFPEVFGLDHTQLKAGKTIRVDLESYGIDKAKYLKESNKIATKGYQTSKGGKAPYPENSLDSHVGESEKDQQVRAELEKMTPDELLAWAQKNVSPATIEAFFDSTIDNEGEKNYLPKLKYPMETKRAIDAFVSDAADIRQSSRAAEIARLEKEGGVSRPMPKQQSTKTLSVIQNEGVAITSKYVTDGHCGVLKEYVPNIDKESVTPKIDVERAEKAIDGLIGEANKKENTPLGQPQQWFQSEEDKKIWYPVWTFNGEKVQIANRYFTYVTKTLGLNLGTPFKGIKAYIFPILTADNKVVGLVNGVTLDHDGILTDGTYYENPDAAGAISEKPETAITPQEPRTPEKTTPRASGATKEATSGQSGGATGPKTGADEAGKGPEEPKSSFTDNLPKDKQEELKRLWEKMKGKLNQMNMGIDPEMMMDGIKIVTLLVEAGVRKYAEVCKNIAEMLGAKAVKYARAWYLGAKGMPELDEFRSEMDSEATVEAIHKDLMENQPKDVAGTGTKGVESTTGKETEHGGNDTSGLRSQSQEPEGTGRGAGTDGGLSAEGAAASAAAGETPETPAAEGGGVQRGGGELPQGGDVADRGDGEGAGGRADATNATPEEQPAGTGEGGTPEASGEIQGQPVAEADRNHQIAPDDTLIPGGDISKIKANIEAIKLLNTLEAENRNPTPDEKKVLAQFVGWGGLPQVFDQSKYNSYQWSLQRGYQQDKADENWFKKYGKYYETVKEMMTEDEWNRATVSTTNAHYTSRDVIEHGLWAIARQLGVKGGNFLENSAGIGHVIGLTPKDMLSNSKWDAVELDSLTGRMLAKLYPEARVQVKGFEEAEIPNNTYALNIGNVPFSEDVTGDKRLPAFSLHNYFLARSILAVKPGGFIVAITSNSTMDAPASAAARLWLAERADLVAAIRLPNDAFKKNANTEVTTDILVLRKKDGQPFQYAQPWLTTKEFTDTADGKIVNINEYFANHPDMMLGKMSLLGKMHRKNEQALVPHKGRENDLVPQLKEAVAKIPADIANPENAHPEPRPTNYQDALKEQKEKSYQLQDGKVMQVIDGKLVPPEILKDKSPGDPIFKQAKDFISLRETYKRYNAMMRDPNVPEEDVDAARAELNKVYDDYVKRHDNVNKRSTDAFEDDAEISLVRSLEVVKSHVEQQVAGKGKTRLKTTFTYEKADALKKRTIQHYKEPTKASNLEDAVQISISYRGLIVPEFVAKLMNTTPDKVRADLLAGGNVFEHPETGMLETPGAYLSGNVKEKLRSAEWAAKDNPIYQRNVEELKKVQPKDLHIGEIKFRLGSAWIPPQVISDWMRNLGMDSTRVSYQPVTGEWDVPDKNEHSVANTTQYGITTESGKLVSAKWIINRLLNLRKVEVYETDADGNKFRNPEATLAAQRMGEMLDEMFQEWALKSRHADTMVKLYNDNFNFWVKRTNYDPPNWQTYPGASEGINLWHHQRNFTSRAMGESAMLAHCVGSGKTYTAATTAMEWKRLGLANKTLIPVLKSTLKQFAAQFMRLYPTANILVPSEKDFSKDNRETFLARIASGDYDAIIITHDHYNRIPDDPERQKEYLRQEIAELWKVHDEAAAREGKNSPSAKAIAKAIRAREKLLAKLMDRPKDNNITFEQLGIDGLILDEAHFYKKIPFITKMDRVRGLDKQGSKCALSHMLKVRHIQEKTGGKNIVTATGTPISNTMAEIWNHIRVIRPEILKQFKIDTFDRFASTFGLVETRREQRADGVWRELQRFSKFINGPEFLQMVHSSLDIVNDEDINLPKPKMKNGKPTDVVIKPSNQMIAFQKYLLAAYEEWENLPGDVKREKSHIPLCINTLACKGSIDLRMVDPNYFKDEPGSKLNVMADRMHQIYKESSHFRGVQLVFMDIYQSRDGKFNAFEELKRKLIERGVPAKEIAIIDEKMKDVQKNKIFDATNAGEIRFLMGSTPKIGTGVNVQELIVALHHSHAPWVPNWLTQRNGRALRTGNKLLEMGLPVEVLYYGIERGFDAGRFDLIATKDFFINQTMRGLINSRVFEDITGDDMISYKEAQAAFAGDNRVNRRSDLEMKVRGLKAMRTGWLENQGMMKQDSNRLRHGLIPDLERDAEVANKQVAEIKQAFSGDTMTVEFSKDKSPQSPREKLFRDLAKEKLGGEYLQYSSKDEIITAIDKTIEAAVEAMKQGVGGAEPANVNEAHHRLREWNGGNGIPLTINGVTAELYVTLPLNLVKFTADEQRWTFGDPKISYGLLVKDENARPPARCAINGDVKNATGLLQSLNHNVKNVEDLSRNANTYVEGAKKRLADMEALIGKPWEKEAEFEKARADLYVLEQDLIANPIKSLDDGIKPAKLDVLDQEIDDLIKAREDKGEDEESKEGGDADGAEIPDPEDAESEGGGTALADEEVAGRDTYYVASGEGNAVTFKPVTGDIANIKNVGEIPFFVWNDTEAGAWNVNDAVSGKQWGTSDTGREEAIQDAQRNVNDLNNMLLKDPNGVYKYILRNTDNSNRNPWVDRLVKQRTDELNNGVPEVPKLQWFMDVLKKFTSDEGGYLRVPDEQTFKELADRYHAVMQSIREYCGAMFPRTHDRSERGGDQLAHLVNCDIWAPIVTRNIVEQMLDKPPEGYKHEEWNRLMGAIFTQAGLDYTRAQYLYEAEGYEAAGEKELAEQAREAADAVQNTYDMDGNPFVSREEYERLIDRPEIKAVVDRGIEVLQPVADKLYTEAAGLLGDEPLTPRSTLGLHISLLALREGEFAAHAIYAPGARPGKQSNPFIKKSPFATKRTGSAKYGYNIDLYAMVGNMIARQARMAATNKLYKVLVEDGAAVYGPVSMRPGEYIEIGGKPAKDYIDVKRQTVIIKDNGSTQAINQTKRLYMPHDVYEEVRKATRMDAKRFSKLFKRVANIINWTALASTTEAAFHLANQFSAMVNTPYTGIVFANFIKNAYLQAVHNKDTMDKLERMAREGYLKPGHEKVLDKWRAARRDVREATGADKIVNALNLAWQTGPVLPMRFMGAVINYMDRTARLVLDDAFDKMVKKGLVKDTQYNRRNLVNLLGQYNIDAQHTMIAAAREWGIGPFATAGTNFWQLGIRSVFGSPGVEAADWKAWIRLRAMVYLRYATILGAVAAANYFFHGDPMGSPNVPFGAVRLPDSEDGKKVNYFDVMDLTPFKRGLRAMGLLALIEGTRINKPAEMSTDSAWNAIWSSALRPYMGPAAHLAEVAFTGKSFEGYQVAEKATEGQSQAAQNVMGALQSANPIVGAMYSAKHNTEAGSQLGSVVEKGLGKFTVKSKPNLSTAQKLASEYARKNLPDLPRTQQADAAKAVAAIAGKSKDIQPVLDAIDRGEISYQKGKAISRSFEETPLQRVVAHLKLSQAIDVYAVATDKERDELRGMVQQKASRAAKSIPQPMFNHEVNRMQDLGILEKE